MNDLEQWRLADPYNSPVWVQGHRHSEPICAWPDCETYLTREQMAELQDQWLTPQDAADRITARGIRVARTWVLERIKTGELPAKNKSGGTGRGVRWQIDPAELDRWLEEWLRAA